VEKLPNGMALDMAEAYPTEAGVQRCYRTICLDGACLNICDEIALDGEKPVTWVFMLRHKPEIHPGGCTLASGFHIRWDEALTAAAEPIDITDGRMKNNYPGTLWRLTLTAAPAREHRVHITMQP
jgi:hypothetical protein